jgi:kinesin family protein 1
VIRVPKNPAVLKGGYLLVPNADSTRWVKRFVELRRPYLHVHSVGDGEEVGVVSLRNARVDSQPGILGLLNLHGSNGSSDGNGDGYGGGEEGGDGGGVNGGAGGYGFGTPRRGMSPSPSRSPAPASGGGTGRLIASLWPGGNNSGAGSGVNTPNGGSGGISRLSERLQAGVFAVYGTDNTWLFAARSERDKMDWIMKIDQSFAMGSGSGSASGSGTGSPRVGW